VYVRTPRKWISRSVLAGVTLAAAGIGLWHIPAVLAEDAIVIDGQDTLETYGGGGMPSSNPRVKPLLAAHPDQFVVLCVAGCGDNKTKIVQMLPKPVKARTAEFLPSAAGPGQARANGRLAADEGDDVVCVAGCTGKPGQVVQRNLDLPPPPVIAKPEDKTSDAAPSPALRAPAPEKDPEPLDIHP